MKQKFLSSFFLSLSLAVTLNAASIGVKDVQDTKSSSAVACCANLVSSGGLITTAPADGAEQWNSIGLQKVGTVSLSSGSTPTSGGGGTPVAGASNYFSDANSISGTGLYGATSGSGTWTVPAGVTKMQVVIVGGGANGTGGGCSVGGSGGGSGYVIAKTAYVTAGTQIPWSVGGAGTQSCFNGWCAAGGSGKNGGSGAGAGYVYNQCLGNGTGAGGGGAGGGYGGFGGAGGSGGSLGNGVSGASNGNNSSGYGQGSYTTSVSAPLTAKLFSTGASSTLSFTSGGNGGGSYPGRGGTGYGGGGGGGSSAGGGGGTGGNGAIFVWTE